jgi:hypothetical protein
MLEWLQSNVGSLVAVSALFVAMHQGYVNRTHARKSVRPHLTFEIQTQNIHPQIQVYLQNDGLGPAIFHSFSVQFDGIDRTNGDVVRENVWREIGLELPLQIQWGGGAAVAPGQALSANSSRTMILYCLTNEGETAPNFDTSYVHRQMRRIRIFLKYQSIYGESFVAQFPHA